MQDGIGEFKVGTMMKSQSRTISEGDFTAMANLSWETGQLHTDKEFMKSSQFGERILGGPCVIPFVAGLSSHPLHNLLDRSPVRLVALVGIENVRFTNPLQPGDTMRVETEVAQVRPTSKGGRFIVHMKDTAYKHNGNVIMEMERVVLMEKDPAKS